MLLTGVCGLTGVMQGTQWGQSEYLPILAQQNLGLSYRQGSSDGRVLPLLPISLQTESSAIKAKKPQKSREKIWRVPSCSAQLFIPSVSPHQAVEMATPDQAQGWGMSHPE